MADATQSVDVIASMLGGKAGQAAGLAAKPWFWATVVLVIITFLLLLLMIMLSKRSNGFRELRASMGGKRVCWFFDDTRTAEMRILEPSAGIVRDDIYGDYIINEKGTYVDKRTRNIVIPFSSSLAIGSEVKHFQAADQLAYVLGDEKELQKVALALANGELKDTRFDALRMSVNFGSLKSFANTMLPHNISAKINLEIAKRVKSYGAVNTKQLMWFVIIGMGLIAVMALVLYMIIGGKGGSTTNIIQQTPDFVSNMTGVLKG